jgi:hypothetical protein
MRASWNQKNIFPLSTGDATPAADNLPVRTRLLLQNLKMEKLFHELVGKTVSKSK